MKGAYYNITEDFSLINLRHGAALQVTDGWRRKSRVLLLNLLKIQVSFMIINIRKTYNFLSIYSKSNAVSAHTNKTFSKKEAPNIFQAWMLDSLQRDFTLQTYPLHHQHGCVVVTARLVGLKIKWRSAPEFAKTAFEFISISFNLVGKQKSRTRKVWGKSQTTCMHAFIRTISVVDTLVFTWHHIIISGSTWKEKQGFFLLSDVYFYQVC